MSASRKIGPKITQRRTSDQLPTIMDPADIKTWNEKMNKMSFTELPLVEYKARPDNNWKKIFVPRLELGKEIMKCVLCDIPSITKMASVKQHLNGKKHQQNFKACVTEVRLRPNNSPKEKKIDTKPAPSTPVNAKGGTKIVLNPLSLQKKQPSAEQNKENKNTVEDLKKFRDNLVKMDISDLLLIEYKFVNTDWQNLFKKDEKSPKNKIIYTCSMCKLNVNTFAPTAIKVHMTSRQHQRNIELVKELHHPKLRPMKEIITKDNETSKPSEDKNAKTAVEIVDEIENDGEVPNTEKSNLPILKETPTTSKTNPTSNEEEKSQSLTENKDKDKEPNIVINPVHIQKQTIEATTTGKNLKDVMKSLEVIDLLKIEYRYNGINSEWKKMFVQYPDTTFKCLLCGTFLIKNLADLRQHIVSARHQTSINAAQKLFHPTLAPTKSAQEKEALPTETYNQKIQEKDQGKMEDKEFREHVVKLSAEDLKKVEFLLKGRWAPLINMHGNIIMCNLCDITGILGHKTYINHLTGKKHSELMNEVDKLFHPVFTYAKDHVEGGNKSSENNTVKKTVEKSSDSQIICTIIVEDSPDREIPNIDSNKTAEKVVNPASVIAKSNEQLQEQRQNENNLVQSNFRGGRRDASFGNQDMNNSNQFGPPQNRNFQQFRGGNQFQGDNSQRNNNFGPNINQGDRIITPRVRSAQDSSKINQPTFSSKDLTSTKIEEVEGLVGVEYVVKILRNVNDTMPRFECCLCEIEVDGVGMQFHLKGLLHRKKYLERHFPTAMRQFSKYKDDPKFSNVISQICDKLAIAVEKYHGRELPFECLQEEFRSNRDGIMSKVFSFRHASELSGPSFTNSVDKNLVDKFISNKDSYKAPQPDPTVKPTFDVNRAAPKKNVMPPTSQRNAPTLGVEEHRVLVEKFLQNTSLNAGQRPPQRRNRSRSRSPRRRSPRSRDRYARERSPRKSQPLRPPARSKWELYSHSLKSPVRTIGGDIWDSYRRMFDHAVEDLDRDYKEYKRDPETHPLYDEEWRKYWLKKSKTLRSEGRDTSTYNFQPGWVRFFSRRVHQLYEQAVEDIRLKLRERLGLPRINNILRHARYHIGVHCVADPVSDEDEDIPETIEPERVPEKVPSPKQRENYQFSNKFTPVMKNITQVPQTDRFSKDCDERYIYPMSAIERQKPSKPTMREKERERPKTEIIYDLEEPQKDDVMELEIETGPLSSVSVLRLLTALEDQLGSLGPKVIDLLSKALTLEKVKPNCADESLMTLENCVFLETVNEKLKGQILAGVIEGSKIKAVKQAIKDLTELLKIGNEHLAKNPKPPPAPREVIQRPSKPLAPPKRVAAPPAAAPAPKVQCLDKQDVAAKLAAALTAQGKTDFSSNQLEQLVAVYTLIEKKQRENAASNKPDGIMDGATEQQKKSLSETLLDFLKPNAAGTSAQANLNVGNQASNLTSRGQLQTNRNQSILNPNSSLSAQQGLNRLGGNNFSSNQFLSSQQQQQQQRSQPSSSLGSYSFSQLSNFDTSLSLPNINRNSVTSNSGANTMGSNQIWANRRSSSSINMPQQNQQLSSTNMNQMLSAMSPTNISNLSQMIQGLTNRSQNSANMNLNMNQGLSNRIDNSNLNMNPGIANRSQNSSNVNLSMNQGLVNRSENSPNMNLSMSRGSASMNELRSGQSSFGSNQSSNQQNQYGFNQSGNTLGNNNMQQNRSSQQTNIQNQYGFNQSASNFGNNMQQNRSGYNQNQNQNIRDNFNLSNLNSRQIWANQNPNQQQQQQRFLRDDDDDDDDDDNDQLESNNNAPAVTSTSMTRGPNPGNKNNPFAGSKANSSLISYPSNNNRRNPSENNTQDNNPFRGGPQAQQTPMGWQRNTGGRR